MNPLADSIARALGLRSPLSAETLATRVRLRRAIEAAIWGLPLVSVDSLRQAVFDAGANYGDLVFLSRPPDWNLQVATPNPALLHAFCCFNLKGGPIVIEVPRSIDAEFSGSIVDAWQTPRADLGPAGEDRGTGARYILMNDQHGQCWEKDAIILPFSTVNGYVAFRAGPGALPLVRSVSVQPLFRGADSEPTRHVEISGRLFDGLVSFDDHLFDRLARMVNEEPVQPHDLVTMGLLRSLGIERGLPFHPDVACRATLREGALEAHRELMQALERIVPYWPDSKWGQPECIQAGLRTRLTFRVGDCLDVDNRGALVFSASALVRAPQPAVVQLSTMRDADGEPLDGRAVYRLCVPASLRVNEPWAVTAYDFCSAALIRGAPRSQLASGDALERNPDGSIDVTFGPVAPEQGVSNWLYTAPGRRWFASFSFRGTGRAGALQWKLPDLQCVT